MLPKKFKFHIGEREFEFVEMSCLRRDALLKVIGSFTFAEIMSAVMPILNELNIDIVKEGGEEDAQVSTLIEHALQNESLWGGLSLCLLEALHIGPEVVCLSLCEKQSTDENELYIKNNITVRQEPVILEKIIDINELPQTLKNYQSLLTRVKELAKKTKTNS
jgi:hypothetical protein